MNTQPILFTGPMVRALLEGRKTQTRRVCKPQPHSVGDQFSTRSHGTLMIRPPGADAWAPVPCPYGKAGDLLWVRETWLQWECEQHGMAKCQCRAALTYRADFDLDAVRWRPSIHMPRWTSRITLKLTDVRVEQLQDISEEDATAEGWPHAATNGAGAPLRDAYPIGWFGNLWDDINGCGSWAANPWVWVLGFTVEKRNVDELLKVAPPATVGGERV